jgi:FkbM family methyltransferase
MRRLLKSLVKFSGKLGINDRFFKTGTRIAKFLLPSEAVITVGGYKMLIEPKKDLGLYFGYEGVEPGVVAILPRILKKQDVFMDIGAYKGFYSLMASQFVSSVIAVEPDPESFAFLTRNIQLNGIHNILALNVAISDFEGRHILFLPGKGSRINEHRSFKVKTRTVDGICSELGLVPNLIKMDVEGVEYSVLRGAKKVLSHYRPILLIEVHENADFKLFDFLISFGYRIGLLSDDGEILESGLEEVKEKCRERRWTKYGTKMNQHVYCE